MKLKIVEYECPECKDIIKFESGWIIRCMSCYIKKEKIVYRNEKVI